MAEAEQMTAGEQSYQNLLDAVEDGDFEDIEDACEDSVSHLGYGQMMNLGRSARENHGADVDTSDSPKKAEIRQRLGAAHVFAGGLAGSDDPEAFYVEQDGEVEEVELLAVQTPDNSGGGQSGPTDKTVLYCLTRAETTEERVAEIREALEGVGYELREAGNGDKYAVVLPAPEEPEVDETEGDEDEESDQEGESGEESEVDEEADADEGDDEESSDGESEAAEEEDEEEEDDDDEESGGVSREVVRERLEDRNKSDLYQMATEAEISGRSEMTKDELIEALLDDKDGIA